MSNNLSEENQQLLEEKIARLEKALILETRADERLRLEHEIQALKKILSILLLHYLQKTIKINML